MTHAPPLPSSPAALRNRHPILEVLRGWLPPGGRVLEIAAGSGEHAVFWSAALPHLAWTPSDASADAVAVIAARRAAEGAPTLQPPIRLDVTDAESWPTQESWDAIVCVNMIHIAPWSAAEALFAGAAHGLAPGAPLILYGPFRETETPTAPSNEAFDRSLRDRDPSWGLRRLEDVDALADRTAFVRAGRIAMPANNLAVLYRRL